MKRFLNTRVGKLAMSMENRTRDLVNKVRTSDALSFNPNRVADTGGVTTLANVANMSGLTLIMIAVIILLFLVIFWWGYLKITLDKENCKGIEHVYTKFPLIKNINTDMPEYGHNLCDYYVKTAYNCCASGSFKNDFVNLCALKNCIKQGARCLDFEIYSVNNKPVIAASTLSNNNVKETYNVVPFAKAMEVISLYAFSGSTCPNPNDPLIIHLRILSNNLSIYDDMAKALYNTLEDRLLGKQFSYENNGTNIGAMFIKELMNSVIVIVDKANPLFTGTLLNEYVNIASNSAFMRTLRFKDVKFTPDMDEIIYFNKQNMTICIPDLATSNANYSSALAMSYGCQFVAMSFQNFDPNMQYYTNLFDSAGSSFILRPDRLRYIPTYIDAPEPASEELSYAERPYNPLGPKGPAILNTTS